MTATFEQARDDVFARILGAFSADGSITESIPIVWPDDPDEDGESVPDDGSAYIEASIHFGEDRNTGMGDGERRYTVPGTVVMTLHEPRRGPVKIGLKAGQIFAETCRGPQTPRGVIFRATQVKDAGENGPYRRTRMSAHFEFDQIS